MTPAERMKADVARLLALPYLGRYASSRYVSGQLNVSRSRAIAILRAAGFQIVREGRASKWKAPA